MVAHPFNAGTPRRWRQRDLYELRPVKATEWNPISKQTRKRKKNIKDQTSKDHPLSQKLRIHSLQSRSLQYLWLTYYQMKLQINFYKKLSVCASACVMAHVEGRGQLWGWFLCHLYMIPDKTSVSSATVLNFRAFIPINEREVRLITKLILVLLVYTIIFLKIYFMHECSIRMYDFMPEESIRSH